MEKSENLGKELPKYFSLMLEKLKLEPAFKVRLQDNFRDAAHEVGWDLPEDHPYRVFFDTATQKHFVLPTAPKVCSSSNSIRF